MRITLKYLSVIIFSICISGNAFAQNAGKVIERAVVASTILNKPVAYSIYLPPGYTSSERTYPVIYLLHGYTDDNTGWLQFGEIDRYADKAIADGIIPPMIIVMPNGDSSFYINSYDGKEKYEDFFIKEFMPLIEKTYRIKAEKQFRGVAGLSMGGYGSLIYALKYPGLFAASAPLSAPVWSDDELIHMSEEEWIETDGQLFGRNLKGKARLTRAWYDNSILKIIENTPADDLKKVRYWIDCGDEDHLSLGNCLLHIALMEKKVPHEFRIRDGSHNWTYWRTGITDALQFIGQSFHR